MDSKVEKSKLQICPDGQKCYEVNAKHFAEYAHPHLDAIYEQSPELEKNKYDIPDELYKSVKLQKIQLKVIEKMLEKPPKHKCYGFRKPIKNEAVDLNSTKPETNTQTPFNAKRQSNITLNTSVGRKILNNNSHLSNHKAKTDDIKNYISVVLPRGKMAEKLNNAAPYNMFLTAVTDSWRTHVETLTVTFQEIFDESLGEIESTVQINFLVDFEWLLDHYYFAGILEKPLLVLYGWYAPELKKVLKHNPQLTAIRVKMASPFATSHTKMMLLGYKDASMRVVISTANLSDFDWDNLTQGVWISPKLKSLPENASAADGESPTNFRSDLIQYLSEYKYPQLQSWISRIRKTDFSDINVFLIASVPVKDIEGPRGFSYGHARLGGLLKKYAIPIDESIPIVCQSSSVGSYGRNIEAWIQRDILNSLRKHSQQIGGNEFPPFKMIFPSLRNVSESYDGMIGGGGLSYRKEFNDKQPWLKEYLYQWNSVARHRFNAMPHIKSYTRFNLEQQCVYWFALTSANLSKSAWGIFKNINTNPCLHIANYEAGVLFLPKFVIGEDTFPLGHTRNGIPPFPLPYDVPLTPYETDDIPFLAEYLL